MPKIWDILDLAVPFLSQKNPHDPSRNACFPGTKMSQNFSLCQSLPSPRPDNPGKTSHASIEATRIHKGMTMTDFRFADLVGNYPPFILRTEITRHFPWLTQKTMANIDCMGQGPPAIKQGRTIIYPTGDLLNWLDARSQSYEASQSAAPTLSLQVAEKLRPPSQEAASRITTPRRGRKTKAQQVAERRGQTHPYR